MHINDLGDDLLQARQLASQVGMVRLFDVVAQFGQWSADPPRIVLASGLLPPQQ